MRRETVIPADQPEELARWRRSLFATMLRNAHRSFSYYGLPSSQVVEIGVEVRL